MTSKVQPSTVIIHIFLASITLTTSGPLYDGSTLNRRYTTHGMSKTTSHDIHGGVKMGEVRHDCDDVKWNLSLDWDNSTDFDYNCQNDEVHLTEKDPDNNLIYCMKKEDIPDPIHKCMDTEIIYEDLPPTAGMHRPNWPVFGSYLYCPPQRWIHALEHGAVVFVYHPCADMDQVDSIKSIVRGCLRKHVITPYRGLPLDKPLGILTYGCKFLMSQAQPNKIESFIKKHALQTVESPVVKDGEYSWGIHQKAQIVSDIEDSELCPKPPIYQNLPIAENMAPPYYPNVDLNVHKENNEELKSEGWNIEE